MTDILTLGEALIDFVSVEKGVGLEHAPGFEKAAGGAPANVAAALARLGISAGFLGKVGDDAFGRFLVHTLEDAGVVVSGVHYSSEAKTGLAFVSIQADGERDFVFYRHPSADMLLTPEEVDRIMVEAAQCLHFGSISLIQEPSRSATLRAVEIAQSSSSLVSFDPNLRLALWPDARAAREGIELGWGLANVIKISDAELEFLINKDDGDVAEEVLRLWHDDLQLVVVTAGRQGCTYVTPESSSSVPGFEVETVDATGAGDGFVAGLLKGLLEDSAALTSDKGLHEICRYANAVGALTTTKRGAIPALPTAEQVSEFLQTHDPRTN